MRNNLLEALMGAIVLTIAAIFLGFAYTSSQTNVNGGYHLKAFFERIDGLNMGGDVKLSGVKVGTITDIGINPQSYQAIVTFSIRSDLLIPEDSSAEITSESLLGGKYVALVPGGSDVYLQDGQSIENTQPSLSFESLISKFLLGQGDKGEAVKEALPIEEPTKAVVAINKKEAAKAPMALQSPAAVPTPPTVSSLPQEAYSTPPVATITPSLSRNNSLR